MPTPDPNQKMEDLLRACARKRREEAGAPFELSPDVRARLQEEVRRTLGKPAAAPAPRWGLSLTGWLRLALGGAVTVLVILVLRSNTPPPTSAQKQLAQAEKKAALPVSAPAAKAPAPAAPSRLAEDAKAAPAATPVAPPTANRALALEQPTTLDDASAKTELDKKAEPPKPATASNLVADGTTLGVGGAMARAPAGIGGGAGGFGGGNRGGGAGGGLRGGRGGAAAANPADQVASISPPTTGNMNAAGQAAFSTATRNAQSLPSFAQQMSRFEPLPAEGAVAQSERRMQPASSAVLAAFQIERTGEQVRIVEADGSAYEGRVVSPETLDQLQAASMTERKAAKDAGIPPVVANAAPQNAPPQNANFGNLAAQNNSNANAQANAGGLPPGAANFENAARNQASSSAGDALKLAGPQQAGDGGGFAFQVSGLNRKLNQPVSISGTCLPVLLQQGATVIGGNISNQSQTLAGANAAMKSAPAAGNNIVNYNNIVQNPSNVQNVQNVQNAQNAAAPGQFWRVSGQVQIGPSNRFNLDAATAQP
jgi:hypothetical protein